MHQSECFPKQKHATKNQNSLNCALCNNNNNWVSPRREPNAEHRVLHTPAEWLLFSVAYHSTYPRWILISNERTNEWACEAMGAWVGKRERERKGEKTWFKIFQICWNFYGTFWMLYAREFAGSDWLTGCQTRMKQKLFCEKNMTRSDFSVFFFFILSLSVARLPRLGSWRRKKNMWMSDTKMGYSIRVECGARARETQWQFPFHFYFCIFVVIIVVAIICVTHSSVLRSLTMQICHLNWTNLHV